MPINSLEGIARDPRVTVRRAGMPDPTGRCVVYWMQRAQRAIDNPALEMAIEAANLLGKPVVVFFGLMPNYPNANLRHFTFLIQGLLDTAKRLRQRGIGLVLRSESKPDLARFCEEVQASLLIGDENPLRGPESWRQQAARELRVPFWTVDADVRLLEKEHYAARTIRPRIRAYLDEFLKPIMSQRPRVPWKNPAGLQSLTADGNLLKGLAIDRSVQPVLTLTGGTSAGSRNLQRLVKERLENYAVGRNHPELEATSRLSPYLHFGHLGPLSVALAVKNANASALCREATNCVRFDPRYDGLEGCEPWALRTLAEHTRDEREYVYTEKRLEGAATHDPLWNAAQTQMANQGWMHGYLRMYWAKKILEWTKSPQKAFDLAIRLNDKYELDGRDPNGYAGIAWAIGGKHDRAWGPERPVYGKIRYMSYASTSRKFDCKAYISMVNGG